MDWILAKNHTPVHWWIEYLPWPAKKPCTIHWWIKCFCTRQNTGIVHWWIAILLAVTWSPNSPLMDYMLLHSSKSHAQSTDGLKIFATDLINIQSTDGLNFYPCPDKKKQSSDGLKIVCCWNKNFLCFARQNHTNSPLIDWILHSSKSYALYAMKFYTCPDFNQMHTFHCRIQKCSPVQLKITGKQMDEDISPTLANNHMHTVQTRTKTFLSTISPLTNLV